jgi:hypothetical protein
MAKTRVAMTNRILMNHGNQSLISPLNVIVLTRRCARQNGWVASPGR